MEKSIQIKGIKKSEHPKLYSTIERVMDSYDMRKIRVFIIPWGVNAFAIWLFGDFLIITKKVLAIMNEKEIEAIVAHEFSHLFNRHSITVWIIYLVFGVPLLFTTLLFSIIGKIGIRNISPALIAFSLIIFWITMFIFQYGFRVINWVSIQNEIKADREAVLKTKNPEAMVNALLKLYFGQFTKRERPGFFEQIKESFNYLSYYFYGFTHPGPKERIEYLEFAKRILDAQKDWDNEGQKTKD